jgi:hypothetical protein
MVVVDEGHCRLESCGIEVQVGDEKNSAKPERGRTKKRTHEFLRKGF